MTTTPRDYKIISADSHFTEPHDLWMRYVEPQYRDRAPRLVRQADKDILVCDDAEMGMVNVGTIHGVYRKSGEKERTRYSEVPASGYDPEARIADIERDGIFAEVLYPTIGLRLFGISDVLLGEACLRAYNTWASDFCKRHPDRYKAIAQIMLDNVENAVGELKRCKDLGLAGGMVSVDPEGALPYHDARYDPFWRTAAELNMPISLHVATARRRAGSASLGRYTEYESVQHVLVGLITGGIFDKYPSLQIVSAENDAGWAGLLIERMDYFQMQARFRNANKSNKEYPSYYWRNHVSYSFMRDRTAILAREIIGIDRLMWSNDFPHGDSTWPDSQDLLVSLFQGTTPAEKKMLLHDNAKRTWGFQIP